MRFGTPLKCILQAHQVDPDASEVANHATNRARSPVADHVQHGQRCNMNSFKKEN